MKRRLHGAAAAGILPTEFIDCFAVVFLACLGEGLGPFGVIDGIGIELGFQSDAGAFTVVNAALAGLVQEITRIELDAGTVGVDGHAAAGGGITQNGAGRTENLEIMIIAALQLQRLLRQQHLLLLHPRG